MKRVPPTKKAILGTARADRVPRQSAMERLKVPPAPPATLTDAAKAEWVVLAAACVDLGVLSGADLRALSLLCETLATEAELRETLRTEGSTIPGANGNLKANPACKLLADARTHAARLLAEFGLTPKSRLGVEIRPPSSAPKPAPHGVADKYFP